MRRSMLRLGAAGAIAVAGLSLPATAQAAPHVSTGTHSVILAEGNTGEDDVPDDNTGKWGLGGLLGLLGLAGLAKGAQKVQEHRRETHGATAATSNRTH